MRIVLFDLETGGVEPHHPNIQLAAVAGAITPDGFEEHEALDVRIQFDERDCTTEALDLNSYDREVWAKSAINEKEALGAFIRFCRRHSHLTLTSKRGSTYKVARLGGHNVQSFDIPRLQAMGERNGDPFLACCWWYPLDSYQGAIWHFARFGLKPPANYRLETLAKHFGIDSAGAHDALADVRMTADIMCNLLSVD